MSETIQDRIRQRLATTGQSARGASLRAGLAAETIRKILARDTSNPRSDTIKALARGLDCSEAWLIGESQAAADAPREASTSEPRRVADSLEDLPILGTAAGSLIGAFQFEDRVIGYVERPPALRRVTDAYAVYITGYSMEPEHRHGDLRFIDPVRPPRIGEAVIVQVQNSKGAPVEGYIGKLAKWGGDKIEIAKLNPDSIVSFDSRTVRKLHRVLTVNEMYGR